MLFNTNICCNEDKLSGCNHYIFQYNGNFLISLFVVAGKISRPAQYLTNIIQIVDGEESNTENIGRRNSCIGRGVAESNTAFLSPIFSVLDDSPSTNCYILIPITTKHDLLTINEFMSITVQFSNFLELSITCLHTSLKMILHYE